MKRFSVVEQGYDINEVNQFVDVVIQRLEKLNRENSSYLNEVSKLKEEVSQKHSTFFGTEQEVTQAIIAANEAANRMKQVAKDEARLIVNEAKDNATAIVHEALVHAQKTEQEVELLKKDMSVYITRVRSIVEAQLKLVEELEKGKSVLS